MAHNKTIQAIRIYLDSAAAENLALGIFTVPESNSEIRLTEEPLVGTALEWKHGLIAKNGIGPRSEGGTIEGGGVPADYSGMTVDLQNTGRYLIALRDLGIELVGLTVELWEFIGSETDSDAVSAEVMATYIVEDMSYDEAILGIPLKNAWYKRNAQMLKAVNTVDFPGTSADMVGKMIPATFGELYPSYNSNGNLISSSIAKYIRVEDFIDTDMYTNATLTAEGTDEDIKIFPVYSVVNEIIISLQLNGTPKTVTIGENVYLKIVSGTGSGQMRRVTGMAILAEPGYATFYIATPFKNDGQPSAANDDTRSWCQILHINRNFVSDFWPLKSFLESTTGAEATEKEIYLYEDGFIPVSQYGLDATGTDNNSLQVQAQQYSANIDELDSFKILPIELLNFITDATLALYSFPSIDLSVFNRFKKGAWYGYPGTYLKIDRGKDPTEEIDMTADSPEYDPSDVNFTGVIDNKPYDKDVDTAIEFDISGTFTVEAAPNDLHDFEYIMAFKGELPKIPNGTNVEKMYLGIKMTAEAVVVGLDVTDIDVRVIAMFRRFAHTKTTDAILEDEFINSTTKEYAHELDNIPSFYADNVDDNDRSFYLETDTTTGTKRTLKGYSLFEITNVNVDTYNAYQEFALLIERSIVSGHDFTLTDAIKIYEIAIIFKLESASMSKEVFAPVAGRIFNDNWGDERKTAANLMQNPVDIIEHCKRLQCWAETGETGTEWGKEYATSAKIATGADEGSFDSTSLSTMTAQYPAFQLETESEGYTADLVKRLCRTFDLCTYIGPDGAECIETMELTDPAETIAFTDLAGDVGEVEEPRVENVFCEPVVNYEYNAGSGEYGKTLRVFNIAAYAAGGAWTASSSGFTSQTDAETVLDLCAALWERFRSVEKCPSDFTDQRMIVTEQNAVDYLVRKLSKMDRARLRGVPVHYDKGRKYHFAKHVQLNLPHQTRGGDVECMIERVEKNKNDNRVTCDLILLEAIPA